MSVPYSEVGAVKLPVNLAVPALHLISSIYPVKKLDPVPVAEPILSVFVSP